MIDDIEMRIKKLEERVYSVGTGFDSHRFMEGTSIQLGGVTIPFSKGILAHSDGDVLLHAIIDALLGATALSDIGTLFPDTSDKYRGADSRELFKVVYDSVLSAGWTLLNLDTTIIAEKPKISPYREQIVSSLQALTMPARPLISVKGKTAEGMGFVGSGEGIAVYATVLLRR